MTTAAHGLARNRACDPADADIFDVSSDHHFLMATKRKKMTPGNGGMTTAIHIPKETWSLLRRIAFRRAEATGGRASVSKVITELVEQNRRAFEKELQVK